MGFINGLRHIVAEGFIPVTRLYMARIRRLTSGLKPSATVEMHYPGEALITDYSLLPNTEHHYSAATVTGVPPAREEA
jgi:hypothetical protein